jgi:hypothetical protein
VVNELSLKKRLEKPVNTKTANLLDLSFLVLVIAGFVSLSTSLVADEREVQIQPKVGHLLSVEGDVELNSREFNNATEDFGMLRTPEASDPLRLFDTLITHNGRAVVEFDDRDEAINAGPSILELAKNSSIEITRYGLTLDQNHKRRFIAVVLANGEIRGFVKGWGNGSGFSIQAGKAIINIKGTEFTINYQQQGERLRVEVHVGEVVITTPYGSETVKQGQSAGFKNGKNELVGDPS